MKSPTKTGARRTKSTKNPWSIIADATRLEVQELLDSRARRIPQPLTRLVLTLAPVLVLVVTPDLVLIIALHLGPVITADLVRRAAPGAVPGSVRARHSDGWTVSS